MEMRYRPAGEENFVPAFEADNNNSFALEDSEIQEAIDSWQLSSELERDDAETNSRTEEPLEQPQNILGIYLNQISKHELLSSAQEKLLGEDIKDGRDALQELVDINSARIASPEEIDQLQARIDRGKQAEREMVKGNLPLVVSEAKGYRGRGVDFEDLIQEGNIGLMKAAEKFDPDRNVWFATHGKWWIRQGINRAIEEKGRTIRHPSYLRERTSKLTRAEERLSQKLSRNPTTTELSVDLGLTKQQVDNALAARGQQPISLDVPAPRNDLDQASSHASLEESVSAMPLDEIKDQFNETDKAQLPDLLENYLVSTITNHRHLEVMRRRYGLHGDAPETNEEIASDFGVSKQRINQIEAESLQKLRSPEKLKRPPREIGKLALLSREIKEIHQS